jgi:hypothetical protein
MGLAERGRKKDGRDNSHRSRSRRRATSFHDRALVWRQECQQEKAAAQDTRAAQARGRRVPHAEGIRKYRNEDGGANTKDRNSRLQRHAVLCSKGEALLQEVCRGGTKQGIVMEQHLAQGSCRGALVLSQAAWEKEKKSTAEDAAPLRAHNQEECMTRSPSQHHAAPYSREGALLREDAKQGLVEQNQGKGSCRWAWDLCQA